MHPYLLLHPAKPERRPSFSLSSQGSPGESVPPTDLERPDGKSCLLPGWARAGGGDSSSGQVEGTDHSLTKCGSHSPLSASPPP